MIGSKQIKGVDFFYTYPLIFKVVTIRVLNALVCVFNLEIHQMDVKIVFLNDELEVEIYMNQPKLGKEKKVCNVKSLYGLKQAPKQ